MLFVGEQVLLFELRERGTWVRARHAVLRSPALEVTDAHREMWSGRDPCRFRELADLLCGGDQRLRLLVP